VQHPQVTEARSARGMAERAYAEAHAYIGAGGCHLSVECSRAANYMRV